MFADAPHPFAGIDEIRVGTVKKPLLLEHPARLGEKSSLQNRGVLRIQLLKTEIHIAAVDANLMGGARLAAVHIAPCIEIGGSAGVQGVVARNSKLVGGIEVAVFGET